MSIKTNPNESIRRRSQQLGVSQTSLWRILHEDLGLYPYKIKLTQELKPNDHLLRRNFSKWALEKLENATDFYQKVVFSDEAHFWLNGFVNKQNCRIWSSSNPEVMQKMPLYPQKITVWCGFHAGGVIGPYFFFNDAGKPVTVNGERYRSMLKEYFFLQLEDLQLGDMWFQQDGATCHTAGQTIQLLKSKFSERLISRNGPINWPPRSCDLTPLDFFLWGYVKSLVYSNKPDTLEVLKTNIEHAIAGISSDLCKRVMENWIQRMDICKRALGGHMSDVEFHN